MIDLVPDYAPAALGPTRSAPPKIINAQTPPSTRGATAAAALGSGSILSFFSRQAAAPTAINPVKVVKASARVSLVETVKENVPPTGTSEELKRVSKFFGGSASKGKAVAMDIVDAVPQRVDVVTAGAILRNEANEAGIEIEQGQDDNCDDLEAEAVLRDIELCVELRSHSDRSPITPPVQMAAESEHGDARIEVDKELSPLSGDVDEQSRPKVESVAASPVLETPSPAKTSRQSGHPDDFSEDGGISSPACSTSAQAGWQPMVDNSPDILSSPIVAKARSPMELLVPKAEATDLKPALAVSAPFPLTSDPIVLSSDADIDADSMPRPPKRSPRPPKGRKSSPLSSRGKAKAGPVREGRASSLAVWEDTPRARPEAPLKIPSSGRQKPKKRPVEEEAPPEGASDAVKAVAASWRAKFMLPAASKVCAPTLSPLSSATRSILLTNAVQTPQQTMKRGSKLPPTPQTAPTLGASTVGTHPAEKRLAKTGTAIRLPLSPRSVNPVSKRSASLVLDKANPESGVDLGSPPKKRRTVSALDVSSAQSSDAVYSPSSSSPATVTNPRLLAFKFSGFVRRNSLA